MREPKIEEEAFVQGLCMFASAREPGGDGGLSVAEDPRGRGWTQSFGQRREHHGDVMRWGFQTVQGLVAPSSEGGVAGLTTKRLDPLSMTVFAIPDESMDVSVCNPEVQKLLFGTCEALE